jgi:hypothetical protein
LLPLQYGALAQRFSTDRDRREVKATSVGGLSEPLVTSPVALAEAPLDPSERRNTGTPAPLTARELLPLFFPRERRHIQEYNYIESKRSRTAWFTKEDDDHLAKLG